ncbi:MAG: hypothetical protein CMP47_11380 [Rickettsiales bacterium]|nr:hypothetical protein [Rickettsiales bacterium]
MIDAPDIALSGGHCIFQAYYVHASFVEELHCFRQPPAVRSHIHLHGDITDVWPDIRAEGGPAQAMDSLVSLMGILHLANF